MAGMEAPILAPTPDHQRYCLYEIDLSLLFVDRHVNKDLISSLESISDNLFSKKYLEPLTIDPRHCLYLLTDPIETWKAPNKPTLHCAIQIYIEGEIQNINTTEEGRALSSSFTSYYGLRSKSLVGARIVKFFENMEGCGSVLYSLLTRFYNGETIDRVHEAMGLLITPQRKWTKLHYIGVFSDLTVDALTMWERYEFSVFFVGPLAISKSVELGGDFSTACVMMKLLRDYQTDVLNDNGWDLPAILEELRKHFVRRLSHTLRELDHLFAWRILESTSNGLIPGPVNLFPVRRLWARNSLDERRAESFIKIRDISHFETISHLLMELAEAYFMRSLPIELSYEDELILMVNVLQQRPGITEIPNGISWVGGVIEKVVDYYNTLSPEVVE